MSLASLVSKSWIRHWCLHLLAKVENVVKTTYISQQNAIVLFVLIGLYVVLCISGLRYLHRLTTGSSARRYELRVDLEDFENQTRVAVYSNFTIASSNENFRLDLGAYNGDAGLYF